MSAPVIIDAVVVIILVAFALYGAKRGMFRTLAGLVIVVVSLVGAAMIASTFSPLVSGWVMPLVEEHISDRVELAASRQSEQMPESGDIPPAELLLLLGLDEEVRDTLAGQAEAAVKNAGVTAAAAVAESLIHTFVYGVVYLLAYLLLWLMLNVLAQAMNLVTKLPVVHGLNALGGGVLGLAEGVLLLFLAVWVARLLGVSFERELLREAHILRIFTENTPLSLLRSLQ